MVGGVGYRVFVSVPTASKLAVGQEATLHTYTHVREDALLLYGFSDLTEQELFEILLSVSGVGPKLALAILSQLAVDRFVRAILHAEVKVLTQVTGVGKKTAERLILELKDRLKSWEVSTAASEPADAVPTASAGLHDDVTAALIGLGYSAEHSHSVVLSVLEENPDATLELTLRAALKRLQSE